MSGPYLEIVIIGVTRARQTFGPSDWAERLCGCMSLFGEDQRINYSPYVKPIISAGIKCVVIDCRLEVTNPEAFSFLMSFARDNELQVREGRHQAQRAIQLQAQAA
ncbi:MAG TPA: DUF3579 domain-containing protein [Burkholderiales bacterium]|jgi:hypothetical protein|nr:DUF3579 domain-containing protein [Burkholderiales bacterium]